MKIFVAASYSSKVNYDTGEVFPEFKAWLENILSTIEKQGHTVFCALRADQYRINNEDPAAAFSLDMQHISESDVILALVNDKASAGVQTEIGVGVALKKQVIIAHSPEDKLAYFNAAMIKAGIVYELKLPLDEQKLAVLFLKLS
jgi:nucleoside 2-deoxyribosyltransferase